MRRLIMSRLIWIYTVCKNLLLSPVALKELSCSYCNICGWIYAFVVHCLDWLPSNWYMNQHKNYIYFTKILSFRMSFSLIWLSFWLVREIICGKNSQGGVVYLCWTRNVKLIAWYQAIHCPDGTILLILFFATVLNWFWRTEVSVLACYKTKNENRSSF